MIAWPAETALLVKTGACIVPVASGLLIAEGVAIRNKMYGAAKFWSWLAGISLAAVVLCILAGLIVWISFDGGLKTV